MESDENSVSDLPDPGYDIVSTYPIRDKEDTIDVPEEEETGQVVPLSCSGAWMHNVLSEFDRVVTEAVEPDLEFDGTFLYEEGGLKSDDATVSIPSEDNVCLYGSEGVGLVTPQEVPRPVLIQDEHMEESTVHVEGLRNRNVKVLDNTRKGFKIWKTDAYEKTENFRIPTYYNLNAFSSDESGQTFESNDALEPHFVGTIDEKEKDAAAVLHSSFNSAESDGKHHPDVDTMNANAIPDQVDIRYFPDEETGQGEPSICPLMLESNFVGTVEENDDHATPVLHSSCNLTESDGKHSPDVDVEIASACTKPDDVDTVYSPDEETGQGEPFLCQQMCDVLSEFNPVTHVLEPETNTISVHQEDDNKPDDSTVLIRAEKVCAVDGKGVSSVVGQEDLKHTLNLEKEMEENFQVEVEGVQNASVKVVQHTKKGLKILKTDAYEKREDLRIPKYYNLEAFCYDESEETSESLEPNFVGMVEEKERHVSPALHSFHNLTESDGKGDPDVDLEEISNTGDEPQKGKVDEQGLRAAEETTPVPAGEVVCVKEALDSVDKTCTENVDCRGDLEKAGEEGAGEPAAKTSKKKKKNKKAKKQSPAWNSPSCVKSASDHAYTKGNFPVNVPANGSFNARGFKLSGSQSFPKGVQAASENSHAGRFRPTSEQSFAKGVCQASENPFGRGWRPTGDQSFSSFVHQASEEASRLKGFRPTCDGVFAKGFRPAGEDLHAGDGHLTNGNWLAKTTGVDDQPRERKISFSDILIAKRENKASYLNSVRDTKHLNMRYCSSPTPILMSRLNRSDNPKPCDRSGASGPTPTAHPGGTRKVAVVKPTPKETEMFSKKIPGAQPERDFVDTLLSTDHMFETTSAERKREPGHGKHVNSFLGDGRSNFQGDASKTWPMKGRGQYRDESSTDRGFRGAGRQWPQGQAGRHSDFGRGSFGPEESKEMEAPQQLKSVNWVAKEDVGQFFVGGLTTLDTTGNGESGCQSPPKFLTFDELVLLDGLESAVVSVTDSIDTVVAKGFVARFPGECKLHLLVNEDKEKFPEYIIVCCSCPKLIIAHEAGAVKSCPECRFVRLGTYPDRKLKCQFMLLRTANMLRFVLISSSLSICEWETRVQFGWFHDFYAEHEDKSNCYISLDEDTAPFWRDLSDFLISMELSDLDVFSAIDFSTISPAVRLIHTKAGTSCGKETSKYGGGPQLQKIIRKLAWKSPKKLQCLYKTERLGQRCFSIVSDICPSVLSVAHQTSVEQIKVVFPSFRWVNECLANSDTPDRLKLLPTVRDIHSVGALPWNFLHDLHEKEDFVQNYNVLEQYEDWEEAGKTRRYGWFLTGSQALDAESWGEDYPAFHKVVYKHFQLSVGLFPYLRWNDNSKEVEVCAVDLCDVPLPFDPVAVVHYRRNDMPRLVLSSGQNVFRHCVGVFTRARDDFGFIKESPLLKGLLDPFPVPQPGEHRHDVFVHMSSFPQLDLPSEASVVEFFFLNKPPARGSDFIRVCGVFTSIKDARHHFLFEMPGIEVDEETIHKEMVRVKALELGIEGIDDVKQMEDAIEDHYNASFSSRGRGFSYFPTQRQVDEISIEPVKILSDEDWVRDYYKNRRNRNGQPQDCGRCHPRVLLANFRAMKYRFVKELREVEECNLKLEEDNQKYIRKCKV